MSGLTVISYILLTAGGVLLRIALQLWSIDMNTGFYTQVDGMVVAFNLLLAAAVVLLLLLPLLKKPTAGLSGGTVASGTKVFLGFVVEVVAFTDIVEVFLGGGMGGPIPILPIAATVLSIVAGLAFVFEGFYGLSGQEARQPALFTAALPPVWMTIMTLSTFMGYKLTVEISDNMLHILSMVAMLLFIMASSKLSVGVEGTRDRYMALATGMIGSFFCFLLAVPRLVAGSLGATFTEGPGTAGSLVVFALGIYALVMIFPLLRTKQS